VTDSQLEPTLPELLRQFHDALNARNFDLADRLGENAAAREPGNEDVVGFLVGRAIGRRDYAYALRMCQAALQSRSDSARLHFQLGTTLQAMGDREAALAAFRRAREHDPELMVAALWQADQELALGRTDDALRSQMQALALAECSGRLARNAALAPPVRERIERAVAAVQAARRDAVDIALSSLRESHGDVVLARIDRALARLHGQTVPGPTNPLQQPTLLWVPDLPDQAWFEREQFPFLRTLEQATTEIRDELLGVLADETEFNPYIDMPANAPAATIFGPLNRSPNWSAYHLFRHGQRVEEHCRRCPMTTALLESLPLLRIPDHSPEILFSLLKPHTHIPPHAGVINGRLTVHLPLIVPENCGALRAGGDARGWRDGECLIFDDSYLHEAWNDSEQTRVVLILDVWNPYLSEVEREALATAIAAVGSFHRQHGAEDVTRESM
jgi:aspartate beta-hydroxylase